MAIARWGTDKRRMMRRLLPAGIVALLLVGVGASFFADRMPVPRWLTHGARLVSVTNPFALATGPGATSAAAYMTIENSGGEADRLLSATVEVAGSVALEEATAVEGVTKARALEDGLEIPANTTVTLRPGSYRLMFLDLKQPLTEGEDFAGTLTFEKAGTVDVTYAVGAYVAPIGGAFDLIDTDGASFSSDALAGKPFAIFFGYTHCPDVCPATLFEMSEALKELGPSADRLNVVFVSIDPERDTPPLLKSYLSAFDERIIGLTGTPESIAAAAKAFRAFYDKVPADDGDYTMNHSAAVLLMDADGRYVGTIDYDSDAETRLAKLRRLVDLHGRRSP